MSEFDYSTYCNEELFKEFPNLKEMEKYQEDFEHISEYCENGAHSIYERIFCDYVIHLLKEREKNHQTLKKVFCFIERIASHEDEETTNVAAVSFIEPLLDKITPPKLIVPYLGKESLKRAIHTATFRYGWDADPKTWN